MKILVAYVPVLHEGYRKFFTSFEGAEKLYLLDPELKEEFPWLKKEIRELDPSHMQKAINALGIFKAVEILTPTTAEGLDSERNEICLPDEDVSRAIAEKYFKRSIVSFSSIFLRWDKHNSLAEKPVVSAEQITHEEFHRMILSQAESEATKSSDFWRHVGGVVVKEGRIILSAHNEHLPTDNTPYIQGDPRNNFHKGDHIEISSAIHAEAGIISSAARRGVSLEGLDMYLTVFPCPPCAKLIARSGIKNLYCGGGYGVLDGEDILNDAGVKIFFVE